MFDFTSDIKKYLKLLEKNLSALNIRQINQIVNILKTAYDNEKYHFYNGKWRQRDDGISYSLRFQQWCIDQPS